MLPGTVQERSWFAAQSFCHMTIVDAARSSLIFVSHSNAGQFYDLLIAKKTKNAVMM
jgi:hypothetical protein